MMSVSFADKVPPLMNPAGGPSWICRFCGRSISFTDLPSRITASYAIAFTFAPPCTLIRLIARAAGHDFIEQIRFTQEVRHEHALGRKYRSAGKPEFAIDPAFIRQMRSDMVIASSWSWVT